MISDLKKIENAIMELNYYFSKNSFSRADMLWIYKEGERDLYNECKKISREAIQYGNYNRILLLTDDENVITDDLPRYFVVELCKKQTIDNIILWYKFCDPKNNMYVISLLWPDGREGTKWLERNVSLAEICRYGILRLADKV